MLNSIKQMKNENKLFAMIGMVTSGRTPLEANALAAISKHWRNSR